jgi:hypothetical protein
MYCDDVSWHVELEVHFNVINQSGIINYQV